MTNINEYKFYTKHVCKYESYYLLQHSQWCTIDHEIKSDQFSLVQCDTLYAQTLLVRFVMDFLNNKSTTNRSSKGIAGQEGSMVCILLPSHCQSDLWDCYKSGGNVCKEWVPLPLLPSDSYGFLVKNAWYILNPP